jgi:hypothetical protein
MSEPYIESLHREMVDELYKKYGFESHPGYCNIYFRPMIPRACFVRQKGIPGIYIRSHFIGKSEDLKNSIEDICHETAHFLGQDEKGFDENDPAGFYAELAGKISESNRKKMYVFEVLADLGAMVFIENKFGPERIQDYIKNEGEECATAYRIFSRDKELLWSIRKMKPSRRFAWIKNNSGVSL